jgi:hypothetical protein
MLTVTLIALLSPVASGESLVQSLPEDGAWTQFRVILTRNGVEDPEFEWTVRSVGRQQIGGDDHRWIELQSKQNGANFVLYRALIPESEFGPHKNPVAAAKKVWVKYADQPPREIDSVASADPMLALILEGPVADLKTADAKESLDYPDGKLECTVQTGKHESKVAGLSIAVTHRVLKNDIVPFGVAAMTQEFTADFGGNPQTGKVSCTLMKFGKEAKAELTEAN